MKVKEVAKLVGISVRTLHYYDEIGLLTPDDVTEAGYRLYSERNLADLQQILFFRQLDFPLKKIKELMKSPSFDRLEALQLQQKSLQEKRNNLNKLLQTIEKTISYEKGEVEMSTTEKFEGFNFDHNPYEEEARKRWGDKAVDDSNKKIESLSSGQKRKMEEEFNAIFEELAAVRHLPVHDEKVQQLIEKWWNHLNQIGTYSLEAFQGLGEMYVSDERFTKNIDQFGEGLSEFMCEAMKAFVARQRN